MIGAIESVLDDVRKNGITAAELAQAKTTIRSSFLDDLEGGGLPLFGRANLLGVFALFDDDPGRINTILGELDKVTLDDVKAAAVKWLVPTNRTSIDSRPAAKPSAGLPAKPWRRWEAAMIRPPSLLRSFGETGLAAVAIAALLVRLNRKRRSPQPCRRSAPSARSRRRRAPSARCPTAYA